MVRFSQLPLRSFLEEDEEEEGEIKGGGRHEEEDKGGQALGEEEVFLAAEVLESAAEFE